MKINMQAMIIGLLGLVLNTSPLNADGMQTYFADFVNPAVLWDIDSTTAALTVPPAYAACASDPANTVFGVNFTSGLAYRDGILYGLEWENGNGPAIFLYSFATDNCATGTRVGGATGHTNLESLAYCEADGFFYSVDFDFASPHLGQLLRIDPATGVGTLIGNHMAVDVRIVGMVCDPEGQLWAVSSGFATRNAELLKVDRTTGVETLVGELNLGPSEVESLAIDPDKPGQLFAAGLALYEILKSTGTAIRISGGLNQAWAMAGVPVLSAFLINVGHAGAWFNLATAGQGQFIDVEPGSQFMFISWFAYTDALSVNPFEQRWFTAQGNYSGNTAELPLFETLGGKFDDPQGVFTSQIGTVIIVFSDCENGQLTYSLDDEGLQGVFSMIRVIPGSGNICAQHSGNNTQAVDINAGMDGAWFDVNTSGQGFFIDAHPDPEGGNFIFVSWFTYGDNTASGQRWLTAQGSFEGSIAMIDVFETTGGSFDDPQATNTVKVGTMTIDFTDCNNAQLTYSLMDTGAEGDITITRVISAGQALCLELAGG